MKEQTAHQLLAGALRRAKALRHHRDPLTFVTCGYDTTFASLDYQVYRRLAQISAAFGMTIPWRLLIVDDLPRRHRLRDTAERAADRLGLEDRLQVVEAQATRTEDGRNKGASILQGFQHALDDRPDATLVYLNLNLKVHAAFAASGLHLVWAQQHDAAIGTRAVEEGGHVRGVGNFGRAKSLAFNAWVASVLPTIGRYRDTNAPMKVFSPRAAALIAREARNPHITMDVEWLILLHREGMDPVRFPIAWVQQKGSHPPWNRIPATALDVLKLRGGR